MDKSEWKPCIVTYFDLPGIKDKAPTGVASKKMIDMRNFCVSQFNTSLPNHTVGYIWNDSILLLSHNAARDHVS